MPETKYENYNYIELGDHTRTARAKLEEERFETPDYNPNHKEATHGDEILFYK